MVTVLNVVKVPTKSMRNEQSEIVAVEDCNSNTTNEERRPRLRSRVGTAVYQIIGRLPWPVPVDWAPVFLIGCGRSGTTVTGQILSQHPNVCLLNEPRHIWRAALPASDIWYDFSNDRVPRMSLGANDVTESEGIRCRRMFYLRQRFSGRPLLLEKLPINNFRIDFLDRVFPGCRFVHLVRHGLEVARSIAKTGPRWYGANGGQKWRLLKEHARSQGWTDAEVAATHPLARGLVEWTLGLEAVEAAIKNWSTDRVHEIQYDDLLERPRVEVEKLIQFLGINENELVSQWAEENLQRRTTTGDAVELPQDSSPRTLAMLERFAYEVRG